ncbi:MAG TPA: glycogen/starch synthase, partial [Treponemataceae bacterium]|nr:glycogen/starch synthase [Treponemataceae bacterium]
MSQSKIRSLWLVTREYAGIAEAGGVKNVACSLAEGLARTGVAVTAFIPRYGCVTAEGKRLFTVSVAAAGEIHTVGFSLYRRDGVDIVFVDSPIFLEKYAV